MAARALELTAALPASPYRVFLLSPADCSGKRARLLQNPEPGHDLGRRLHAGGAELGEVFAFVSSLYFRGKLAYARAFARTPEGVAVVKRLASTADIVIENYRPGIADAIGLGSEELRATNPRLIYVSVNAFGSRGPWRSRPGTDPVVQAMSGVMSVTGERDGGPVLVGIPIADYSSAMTAVQAVLLAITK